MFFAIVALISYAVGLATIIPVSVNRQKGYYLLAVIATLAALISHGLFISQQFIVHHHYTHATLLESSSLLSWLVCSLLSLLSLRQKNYSLLPVGYLLAFCNITLQSVLPSSYSIQLENSFILLSHIGLALFSYTLLFVAGLYMLQFSWLEYLLKQKRPLLNRQLPSLLSLEKAVRPLLYLGVLLLTLMLLSALPFLLSQQTHWQQLLFAVIAWLLYLYLCYGIHYRYWRGRRVFIYNSAALLLLTISYLSRRFFY